jgi:glycosidase
MFNPRLLRLIFFILTITVSFCPREVMAENNLLQVTSPDWRDQFIYFVMTDRFQNGDKSNDNQGAGEFNPLDGNFYSGGDLRGIQQRLDYIRRLGATSVWITPPVANIWYDPAMKMAGYHGYWAENFMKIDSHMGTLNDYQKLSAELHRRGMFLIQDIVVNHTGDFFYYQGAYDPKNPTKNFNFKKGILPANPTQYPFTLNDARDPLQRDRAIYHWTPDVTDYNDEVQKQSYQVSGLDDLNTNNPIVRDYLRQSYNYWISTAGVDGFRFDTVPYVDHDFYNDFIYSASSDSPGIAINAQRLGKENFLTFGEVWSNGSPFSDNEEKILASYLGTPQRPELGAALNFPLALDLRAVFAKSAPAAQLSYRLDGLNRHFRGGKASVNLVDNQDMARFLSEGSEEGLAQALSVIFTIPGIPLVYAGTEQGFTDTRASMFAAGWGSQGVDHFDTRHRFYRLIQTLADLRRKEPVLRQGILASLGGEQARAGYLAYRIDASSEHVLAIYNSSDEDTLMAGLETGLGSGQVLRPIFLRNIVINKIQLDDHGRLSLKLPSRAIVILKTTSEKISSYENPSTVSVEGFIKSDFLIHHLPNNTQK